MSTFLSQVSLLLLLLTNGAAFLTSLLGTRAWRRWANVKGFLDRPNERSSHSQPVPLGGGVVLAACVAAGSLACAAIGGGLEIRTLSSYLLGAGLAAAVSGVDDWRPLPMKVRFATHCAGALIVFWGIGWWESLELPGAGGVELGWWGLPLTLVWIVGLTNAYNFMDGIDGIAAGQAVVAGFALALLGWTAQAPVVVVIGSITASASLGFLVHNWHPARVFMGDVGSAFLGFTFAVLALIGGRHDPRLILAGAAAVAPFVFDSSFTFARRALRGENVFSAHRTHLYQRCVDAGSSHPAVSAVYMAAAGLCVFSTLPWMQRMPYGAVLAIAVVGGCCFSLWFLAIRKERLRGTLDRRSQ